MNYLLFCFYPIFSGVLALSSVKNFAQRDKSSSDWTEALDDFKTLVHVITFGEEIPSHQANPLQVMIQAESMKAVKNPFELTDGWFGNKRRGNRNSKNSSSKPKSKKGRKSSETKNKKNKRNSRKIASISSSQLREQQSMDDLALLNFLVQLEEPKSRASVQTRQSKKHLSSLITAENRYKEIKKKIAINRSLSNSPKMSSKRSSRMNKDSRKSKKAVPVGKAFSKVFISKTGKQIKGGQTSQNNEQKNKKWYERIDMKGARNTLTLSVAFGVIVTALFCVVIQLFKLFANTNKGSGNGGAFEQINRRSTYGYDKIALDIEEDEENGQIN